MQPKNEDPDKLLTPMYSGDYYRKNDKRRGGEEREREREREEGRERERRI